MEVILEENNFTHLMSKIITRNLLNYSQHLTSRHFLVYLVKYGKISKILKKRKKWHKILEISIIL